MSSSKIEEELNLTLQKIGRNVLHFQRMESMLKFLTSRAFLQGDAQNLRKNFSKNVTKSSEKTLGNLVKEYIEKIYLGEQKINESQFSVQFRVEADEKFIEERKIALDDIVQQRNRLIHQMLLEFDQTSVASCKKLSAILDEQNEKIKTEYLLIKEQLAALVSAYKQI